MIQETIPTHRGYNTNVGHSGPKSGNYNCGKFPNAEQAAAHCNIDPQCTGFSTDKKGKPLCENYGYGVGIHGCKGDFFFAKEDTTM